MHGANRAVILAFIEQRSIKGEVKKKNSPIAGISLTFQPATLSRIFSALPPHVLGLLRTAV
jgi:hypothetical protein